jgi:hypothetical protein
MGWTREERAMAHLEVLAKALRITVADLIVLGAADAEMRKEGRKPLDPRRWAEPIQLEFNLIMDHANWQSRRRRRNSVDGYSCSCCGETDPKLFAQSRRYTCRRCATEYQREWYRRGTEDQNPASA